jgi:hypothetical protein
MSEKPTTLRSAREQTIDALCRHFADDSLGMGELERRLEKARAARSREELATLLADLEPKAVQAGPRERNQPVKQTEAVPEATTSHTPPPSDQRPRPGSHLAFAVMGGTKRAGRWVPPGNMAAVAIMGGVELDFRDAVLTPGVTEINCFAFWGGIDITVPPDVHVDTHGFALMGGFEQNADIETNPPPDAPTIRITGLALMGGVDVKVARRGDKVERPDW